ncbi:MAG: hypothetical protein AAF669_02855 [Pseudomonadota bacterium]
MIPTNPITLAGLITIAGLLTPIVHASQSCAEPRTGARPCAPTPTAQASQSCADPADTYSRYDSRVKAHDVKPARSEYYVMSYSWAPDHCKKRARAASKQPGGKDYLQCGSGRKFGYILHGLWPQGTLRNPKNYPRACRGNQPKIPREDLAPFLCMTPSAWLLQHEYEFHGTCMPDAALASPVGYFKQAQALHTQLNLPDRKLADNRASVNWFIRNNPGLKRNMFYYSSGEWRFCYNADFKPMRCPRAGSAKHKTRYTPHRAAKSCRIKGNIFTRTGDKLYYVPGHRIYHKVRITPKTGERCFKTEAEAIAAGWRKAS